MSENIAKLKPFVLILVIVVVGLGLWWWPLRDYPHQLLRYITVKADMMEIERETLRACAVQRKDEACRVAYGLMGLTK